MVYPFFSGAMPKFQGSQDHFFYQVLIFLFSSFSKLPPLPCMHFLHEEIEVAMNFFMQSMVVLAQWGLASSLEAGDLFAFWDVGVQWDEIWDFSLTTGSGDISQDDHLWKFSRQDTWFEMF